ncbi:MULTISPECIES: DinB family protein [Shouchella]|uniref:DinB family protein n=2 Tax=Shouchella TaxID=2893057 RepID=A0ABY7WD72_9BACI|nr:MULTISPECIES: DinB family protein [Shouchella]MED4128693.1 DinB family protein [Shouchella miscanthi]WDF05727.1 DinB family protein [Shouchella hunanensis]
MSAKEFILMQLGVIHNQKSWFVPLTHALKNVSESEAKWTPNDDSNSIWGIVNHLIFYNHRYLERFKNSKTNFEPVDSIAHTFEGETTSWGETRKHIDQLLSEWREAVQDSEPEDFSETVTDYLTLLTLHNAYHIGQIVSIRKQQGTWSTELGVN